jgi:hypothetical protein
MNQKRQAGSLAAYGSEASPLSAKSRTVAAKAFFLAAISGASPQSYLRISFPNPNVTTAKNPL